MSVDLVAPEDGLMISIATNPFVTAGMPVVTSLTKHSALVGRHVDDEGRSRWPRATRFGEKSRTSKR